MIALTRAAAERGGLYTSHVRDEGNYGAGVVAAVEEVIRIAEEAKTSASSVTPRRLDRTTGDSGHAITHRIESARARGVQVFADQYPYEASSTSLRAALLPDGVPTPSAAHLAKPESMSDAERATM